MKLDCLIDEHEILLLLKAIGLVKSDNTQVINTSTDHNKKILHEITNTKTLIDFTCKKNVKRKGARYK